MEPIKMFWALFVTVFGGLGVLFIYEYINKYKPAYWRKSFLMGLATGVLFAILMPFLLYIQQDFEYPDDLIFTIGSPIGFVVGFLFGFLMRFKKR